MTIPPDLLEESLRLEPGGAWLYLFEIRLNSTQTIRVVRNNAPVTFNGFTWEPFPINVTGEEQDTDGNISELTLQIDNTRGRMTELMDKNNGMTHAICHVYFGNSQHLATPANWLVTTFAVTGASHNDSVASFRLGASPLYDISVPFYRFQRGQCRHVYRGYLCQYAGISKAIASVANTTPIGITTSTAHGFKSGAAATISGVDPAVDGTYTIVVTSATAFTLTGTTAAGAFGAGGTAFQDLPTCDFTFYGANGCRAHSNTENFGGFPSILRLP